MNPRSMAIGAAIWCLATAASAQAVYRCGNEYTRIPCAGGKAIEADSGAPAPRQAAEARDAADRQRRLGDDMARERRAREAALRPAMASTLGPARPVEAAPPASPSTKHRRKAKRRIQLVDDRDFIAGVPRARPLPR